ncbi:MAG: hypothetical protein WBE33_07155, partial [Planococcus citreus]
VKKRKTNFGYPQFLFLQWWDILALLSNYGFYATLVGAHTHQKPAISSFSPAKLCGAQGHKAGTQGIPPRHG